MRETLRQVWPAGPTATADPRAAIVRKYLNARTFWNVVGIAAIIWWASYWNNAVRKMHVRPSPPTWYEPFQFLSLDFLHNYQASRFWLDGNDPYRATFGDPIGRKLCYPPIVLVYFSWCKLLSVGKAIGVWTITLGALAGLGGYAAWRSRARLGLAPVPVYLLLAAVVTCGPVSYAMERGNYDLLLVPCILLAAWGLRRTGWLPDAVIGYSIGLAICLKVYPGLMLAALPVLGRWRALGCTILAVAAFLSFQAHNLPIFAENLQEIVKLHDAETLVGAPPIVHSIPYCWKATWDGTKLGFLAKIPGTYAAAIVVGGLLAWVCHGLYRCRNPREVLMPLLFWIVAAATFVPKVSNDYNLVFLPMAIFAVWDRRDPVYVHAGLGMLCLILQPIGFGQSPSVTFGIKLAGLALAATCLVNRMRERTDPEIPPRATEGFHAG